MKRVFALAPAFAVLVLTTSAYAADYAGRWEISGRQFGMYPSFQPITDGRLEITGSGSSYSATYNALRFTGSEQKDGLHLDCTTAGQPCGALVLKENKGALSGKGTIAGEFIDITGKRPAAKPARATAHEYTPKQFHTLYSHDAPVGLRIFPGDSVHTETVDNRGYDGKNVFRTAHGNPLTGPFYVEGAMPGDTLVVHFTRVRLNRDYAMQANSIAGNALTPGYLSSLPKGDNTPNEWRLDAATNTGTLAKPGDRLRDYKVPLLPMLGCVGVAPPRWQAIASNNLGPWGGNLDSQMIHEGTTVYLPVFHPGALLYIGDTHAQQGDGELPGQAMETSMDVSFTVEVIEGKSLGQTWIETADEVGVMGVGGSLDESLRVATTGLSQWLTDRYHLTPPEIAAVLGTAMRYEIAEVVDPQINIVAVIRKDMLAKIH
jgi:acetamidase/formamidase